MSEIIFASSDPAESRRISRQVKAGELRELRPRVYTSNLTDDPIKIVRRNLAIILGRLYPNALISHRSALEGGMLNGPDIYLTYRYTKKVSWPGVTVHLLAGPEPVDSDLPHLGKLRLASRARALLENMQPSRGAVGKCLPRTAVEALLEKICRLHGENELNRLRDEARSLALVLKMPAEFTALNKLFSAILGTGDAKELSTGVARARAAQVPFDPDCLELFTKLAGALNAEVLPRLAEPVLSTEAWRHRAFFEAYFSNYIEGTEFEVEEAWEIVFEQKVSESRPKDAHDIVGTFQLVEDRDEARLVADTYDDFIALLQRRHAALMSARPEESPGQFKEKPNRAGSTHFVAPELVRGTLRQGFDLSRSLADGFARALYFMFLVAEVHPFKDGNGRTARVFLNAELTHAGYCRIIIPTVLRDDYVLALKGLTNNAITEPYVRVLARAQEFTASVDYTDFAACTRDLEARNAFRESDEARLILKPH
jgi:prophage maintenance system killer protein